LTKNNPAKIFAYLDIVDHELVSEKLYQYILNHTNILDEDHVRWITLELDHVLSHVPELQQATKQVIPARIIMVAIFYTPAKFEGGVHVDHGPLDYRILWPVHNCKGSSTRFFDLNGNKITEEYTSEGNPYYVIEDKHPLVEIANVVTTAPFLFNTKTAHGIYTNPEFDQPRLTATIGFDLDYPIENFLN
jgi:hypothetical protein